MYVRHRSVLYIISFLLFILLNIAQIEILKILKLRPCFAHYLPIVPLFLLILKFIRIIRKVLENLNRSIAKLGHPSNPLFIPLDVYTAGSLDFISLDVYERNLARIP